MWPKALTQLIELAPHIARMLPAADRFLQARSAGDETTRRTLDGINTELHGHLAGVKDSHDRLFRELHSQSERLAALEASLATIPAAVQAARAAAEAAEERASALENRLSTSSALLAILLPLNIVLLALMILLVVRH
jgi:septal ring factor EnvC (AmiA/AmiB activator)